MTKQRILSIVLCLAMVVTVLAGCSKTDSKIIDREGNEVKAPEKVEKIISTAASNTEILIGLGLGDKLVAVDNYSEGIEGIPANATRIDFASPDAEAIIKTGADIVIASGHNKSSGTNPLKPIEDAGITVVYIPSSNSLEDICKDIDFIAEITGTQKEGKKLTDEIRNEIKKIKDIASKIKTKKKVYFEMEPAPNIYSFGTDTFLNDIIETIGAVNIFADQKSWIAPSEESVLKANPDVILTNAGWAEKPVEGILARKGWEDITAVKNKNVYYVDMNHSSRPSQNVVKALREMAKAVYPEHYEK